MLLRKPALCLLFALIAPAAAHADNPQPIPADGQCAVPADRTWTPQEQFVWLKVCTGQTADFSKEPGYGGNLDPKGAAGLPDSRILRSSFLETILLKDQYRGALTRIGVRIIGARFTEQLNLQNANLQHDLWLDGSLLEKGVDLESARTTAQVSFDRSEVVGTFNAPGIDVSANLFLNRAKFLGDVVLLRAHVGAVLDLRSTSVAGTLMLNGIDVDQSLFMRDKARFKDVNIAGAHIGINAELDGCTITGPLVMNGIRIDQNLFMREQTAVADVNLVGAHIGGEADLSTVTVSGTLDMNVIHIGQNLFMRNKAQFKEVKLPGAQISGQIDISSATFAGPLNMYGIHVDGDLFAKDQAQFKDINLFGAHVTGSIDLSGATVDGDFAADRIDVGQSLILGNGAKFTGEVDLRGAQIGQDLILSNVSVGKTVKLNTSHISGTIWLTKTQWEKGATLNLNNATAGTIDLADSWPDRLQANGFTYRTLSDLAKYEQEKAEAWLDRQVYASQPYEQLASILQANGSTDQATDIRYAGKERERRESSGLNWVWLFLLNYSIGFGYHLEYAFVWALGFVLLGWAVLYATGQRSKHGMTLGLAYSFDMLLPLVQLNKKHEDVELDSWPQRYFYVHKLIGVLLASFIAAGISGLTR